MENGQKLFCHQDDVSLEGPRRILENGMMVSFEIQDTAKGERAVNIAVQETIPPEFVVTVQSKSSQQHLQYALLKCAKRCPLIIVGLQRRLMVAKNAPNSKDKRIIGVIDRYVHFVAVSILPTFGWNDHHFPLYLCVISGGSTKRYGVHPLFYIEYSLECMF